VDEDSTVSLVSGIGWCACRATTITPTPNIQERRLGQTRLVLSISERRFPYHSKPIGR
jgi:hypothetical protein